MARLTRRLLHVEHNIRSYLVRRLLPLVESDINSCEVRVPLGGLNTLVRIVRTDNGKGFVVRVLPRGSKKKVRSLAAIYGLLKSKGVAVPGLVDWVESYSKSRLAILAEELIDGKTLAQEPFDRSTVAQLAELFIPLHRVKSPRWGEALQPRRGDFAAYCLKRAKNRLRGVRKRLTRSTDPAVFRAILDWFTVESRRLGALEQFDLTHDKVNPANVLWSESEKRYYLLDLATVRYGVKTKDIVALYHEVLGEDGRLMEQFESAYFAAFPQSEREQNAALWRWFHAYYHLAEAASQIKRARAAKTKAALYAPHHYEKFLHHWRELLAIVGE